MTEVTTLSRKDDHIRINMEKDVNFHNLTTGLEKLALPHTALPEINLKDVRTDSTLFGKTLHSPLLISSMTGGTPHAALLNLRLAEAAQAMGIAMGLGSMRAMIERPETTATFQVRQVAPDILLIANFGAVQLNYGYTPAHCLQLVEAVQADALYLHFNPMQEAVQPEGDTQFGGLLAKVEQVCRYLSQHNIPVIAKEVGWGFSQKNCRDLHNAGVSAPDVAGAGGTSWSQVEMYRAENASQARIAATFVDWGIPTAEAIRNARAAHPTAPIFASGGLRSGLDIAKCIALGADLGGMAGPFLKAAHVSSAEVVTALQETIQQLRIAMFGCGAGDLTTLRHTPLITRN